MPGPLDEGSHSGAWTPFGTKRKATRVEREAVAAFAADPVVPGDIASSQGSATAVPRPRNTVLRERGLVKTFLLVETPRDARLEGI